MHEHGCPGATIVRNYPEPHHCIQYVSASYIIVVPLVKTIQVGVARLGFALEDVGTLSLYSGRATAMHIARVLDRTLMAIGRWHSLGFMVYIQKYISSISAGISVHMSQQL